MFDWLGGKKKQKAERFVTKLLNHVELREAAGRKRKDRRFPAAVGIRVTPLEEGDKPNHGSAFAASTRDITTSGVSFVHHFHFKPGDRLVMSFEFDKEFTHLICVVKHSTFIGETMFLTGCELDGSVEHSAFK